MRRSFSVEIRRRRVYNNCKKTVMSLEKIRLQLAAVFLLPIGVSIFG